MINPQQFADRIGRPYGTVMRWLRNDLVPGVEVTQETRGPVYAIPAEAVEQFKNFKPKLGRPFKPDRELKYPRRRKGQ